MKWVELEGFENLYKVKGIRPTEISKVMDLPLPRVRNVYYGQSWGWLTHETI